MATNQRGADQAAKIIRCIREVRAEHHACTAREVARLTKTTSSLMQRQLVNLRNAGLVEWTTMPGSLRLTIKGGKYAPRK